MTEPYKLIIADDQPTVRQGLRSILERGKEFVLSGEAGNGLELLDLLPPVAGGVAGVLHGF